LLETLQRLGLDNVGVRVLPFFSAQQAPEHQDKNVTYIGIKYLDSKDLLFAQAVQRRKAVLLQLVHTKT